MSNYESLSGYGRAPQKYLRRLRHALIEAHNRQIQESGLKIADLRDPHIQKAVRTSTCFPFLTGRGGDLFYAGRVTVDIEKGTFAFAIPENNHAVGSVQDDSLVWQVLYRFMRRMPDKDKRYGAKTYYSSEYHTDTYGYRTPGETQYYGGWARRNDNEARKEVDHIGWTNRFL